MIDREIIGIMTKADEPTLNSETDTYIESNKEISSPTQPKTLQQEFSLINMNIPNIEVIYKNVEMEFHGNQILVVLGQHDGCCRTQLYRNSIE